MCTKEFIKLNICFVSLFLFGGDLKVSATPLIRRSRSIFKRSTIPNKFKKFIVSDKFSQVASDPPRCVRNANHELIIIDPPPRVSKVDSNSLSLLLKVAASSAPDCEINETKRNTHKIYLVLSLTSRRGARWAPPPSP
jgi:hypothetical protein